MAIDDIFCLLLLLFEGVASHGAGSEYPQKPAGDGKKGEKSGILTTV